MAKDRLKRYKSGDQIHITVTKDFEDTATEFFKMCRELDANPSKVIRSGMAAWVERQKDIARDLQDYNSLPEEEKPKPVGVVKVMTAEEIMENDPVMRDIVKNKGKESKTEMEERKKRKYRRLFHRTYRSINNMGWSSSNRW